MPSTSNPRKRPAPVSPKISAQDPQPAYNAPNQIPNSDFMRYNGYTDNALPYALANNYNGVESAQNGFPSTPISAPAPSTELARRPMNGHLVPTIQRSDYDRAPDNWGQFDENALMELHHTSGAVEDNDSIEVLEEKAAVAKRDATAKRKSIPPFVQKLSSFLDDGKNTELIRWSDRGDSFVVLDEDEFAKTLIPELFKHNNYTSFVRQLNMYGFHKRVGLSDNSMKASERKNKSPSEYYNPFFKRGHPNLLWLINKPKGGNSKQPNKRAIKEEKQERDSDEDGADIEEIPYGSGPTESMPRQSQNQNRAISAAPEAGQLQRPNVIKVMEDIQKQQNNITQAISRLRKDHNQLYQQSMAFQSLHDRHETSINAILTFLATVYNRSIEGQGGVPQDIAAMFANGIPGSQQQQKHQGSVVDIGDLSNHHQPAPGSMSPYRRTQKLLMPPQNSSRAQTVASTPSHSPNPQTPTPYPAVEELFDTPPADPGAYLKADPELPQQDMMDIINTSNAQTTSEAKNIDIPEILSQYETANGTAPLTDVERDRMLDMIARQTLSSSKNKNALVSPSPPAMEQFQYQNGELDRILAMQNEQDYKIDAVRKNISPLAPDLDAEYFGPDAVQGLDPSQINLNDMDQFIDPGAFYGNGGDFNDFQYGDQGMGGGQFDLNMDGTTDRIESADTPEEVREEESTKRRRKE